MAAMTLLHAEDCCHLVSEHEVSTRRLCSSVLPISDLWHNHTC